MRAIERAESKEMKEYVAAQRFNVPGSTFPIFRALNFELLNLELRALPVL
jgi:hypothetical protein